MDEGIYRANISPDALKDLAGKVANRLTGANCEIGDAARRALLELSDRISYEQMGTCWNCLRRMSCEEFKRLKAAGMTCSYCANKEVGR